MALRISAAPVGVGDPGDATVSLSKIEPIEVVAPAGVVFTATAGAGFSTTDDFHDVEWFWDFDDPNSNDDAPHTRNVPNAWKNRNKAIGKYAAHMFADSGTYDVTCWGVDRNGNTGLGTIQVVVEDPNTVYTGSRTILYDPDGVGDNTTYPGSTVVTSASALNTAMIALTSSGRALFKRGIDITMFLDMSSQIDQIVHFGAYGSGARPIIRRDTSNSRESIFDVSWDCQSNGFKWENLDLRGGYDDGTMIGDTDGRVYNWDYRRNPSSPDTAFVQFHNCKISGMGQHTTRLLDAGENPDAGMQVFQNNIEVTDWMDYGFYPDVRTDNSNNFNAFTACTSTRSTDTQRGYLGKDNLTNQHGPFRSAGSRLTIVDGMDGLSVTGWSNSGINNVPAPQALMRVQTSGGNPGDIGVHTHICGEGGFNILGNKENVSATPSPGKYLWDRVICIATETTAFPITWNMGGTTFRNVLGYFPARTMLGSVTMDKLIELRDDGNSVNGNLAERIEVYNCGIVNLNTDGSIGANDILVEYDSTYADKTVQNNIIHAPNQSTAYTAFAPIDTSTAIAGVTLRHPGVLFSVTPPTLSAQTVADSASVTFDYPILYYSTTGSNELTDSTLAASDFASAGAKLKAGSSVYFYDDGDFTITENASDVTVTNTSGVTWSGDLILVLPYTSGTLYTTYAPSSTAVPVSSPQSGSSAYQSASTGLVAQTDLLGVPRPGSERDAYVNGSTSGTASAGPVEP